jgi:hypothetical protein
MNSMHAYPVDRRAAIVRAICLALATGLPSGACSIIERGELTSHELALLNEVAEIMIPQTDTLGAADAGVPAFLSAMIQKWASQETVEKIRDVLVAIDAAAHSDLGKPFLDADSSLRTKILTRLDKFWIGNGQPGYALMKELILTGYYLSEDGATRELRYELVPGSWDGCLPLADNQSAWAV